MANYNPSNHDFLCWMQESEFGKTTDSKPIEIPRFHYLSKEFIDAFNKTEQKLLIYNGFQFYPNETCKIAMFESNPDNTEGQYVELYAKWNETGFLFRLKVISHTKKPYIIEFGSVKPALLRSIIELLNEGGMGVTI